MCGINCIVSLSRTQKNLSKRISLMNSRITHRGPDETTIAVVDKHIVMGFNRLEIVGGEKAKQPIYNKEKTLVLICNGEIYNHKNLQKKYCKKHTFSTTSDAEIILHLYEEMGDAFVSKLEGQFAFILFDKKQKRIIFGRDRFGILPLFFYTYSRWNYY